jgi:hypothetical protein
MPAVNRTDHYDLNQWQENEYPKRLDFVEDNTKIDAALFAKLDKTGDGSDVTAAFTQAATRTSIATGEKHSVLFGKIMKWLADLGGAAFKNIGTGAGDVAAGDAPAAAVSGHAADAAAHAALFAVKAPLASPALTGNPTAPTQSPGNNSTRLATTAYVMAAIAALLDSAPGALDTLNELAAALGDDPNFATTMVNALAAKAPLASPAFTGNPTAPTPDSGDNDTSVATTAFVQNLISNRSRIVTGSYVGTGSYGAGNPCSAIIGFTPKLFIVMWELYSGGGKKIAINPIPSLQPVAEASSGHECVISWGSTTSWYHNSSVSDQMNINGSTFYWVAIG